MHWSEQIANEANWFTQFSKYNKPSISKAARSLGISVSKLSEDLKLAAALIVDPQIANMTREAALNHILKSTKSREQEERAKCNESNSIELFGNTLTTLEGLQEDYFDACITYVSDPLLPAIWRQIKRVLRQNSFLYVFTNQCFPQVAQTLINVGFKVSPNPLIWIVENYKEERRIWEHTNNIIPIVQAVKGTPCIVDEYIPSSTFSCPLHNNYTIHPRLVEHLLEVSTYRNANILDPFATRSCIGEMCKMERNSVLINLTKDRGVQNV